MVKATKEEVFTPTCENCGNKDKESLAMIHTTKELLCKPCR